MATIADNLAAITAAEDGLTFEARPDFARVLCHELAQSVTIDQVRAAISDALRVVEIAHGDGALADVHDASARDVADALGAADPHRQHYRDDPYAWPEAAREAIEAGYDDGNGAVMGFPDSCVWPHYSVPALRAAVRE